MSTVTLEEAQKRLDELVRSLPVEGEIFITDGTKPVAKLAAIERTHSVLEIDPVSVGGVLRPFPGPEEDILGEMLEEKLDKVFPKRDAK
jgi:antitoxin (DNA-binding transcriptional repressor) of toxin-antitoxin stability system